MRKMPTPPRHAAISVQSARRGPAARRSDMAAAATELIAELVEISPGDAEAVLHAVDAFRQRVHATDAVVWALDGPQARQVLRVTDSPVRRAAAEHDVTDAATAIVRLRRNGTIVCRAGELSGIEDLAPAGIASFIAAMSGGNTTVVVLGWAEAVPPCDNPSAVQLRPMAGLLARALLPPPTSTMSPALSEAILGSLQDQIAVVDRDGTVIAVNAAWTMFARETGATGFATPTVGASFFDACRRAAAAGSRHAAGALEGVQAVCSGVSDSFELGYVCAQRDGPRSYLMTVTPLRRADGGAVIVQSEVTKPKLTAMARTTSDYMFHRLADTIPAPIWIVDADGRVAYGNQAWLEATGGRDGAGALGAIWTEAIHPDDRPIAAAAFRSAVARRTRMDVELRLHAADGTYRWWCCVGAPGYKPDGSLDRYLGICADATAKRHAQQALHELAAKLVAAQEEERSRIARELHDDVGQQIALLAAKLDAAARQRGGGLQRVLAGLDEAQAHVQELAGTVHNLSHELHPAKLKLFGLEQTLRGLCRDVSHESGVHVRFTEDGVPSDVSEAAALCVFRLTQESLQNAVKHSGAHTIDVQISGTPTELRLRVSDDGNGFDPRGPHATGIGLLTMRERVELIGGRFQVDAGPGRGTTIEATVPRVAASTDNEMP